jgi:pyruvate,water dikinase
MDGAAAELSGQPDDTGFAVRSSALGEDAAGTSFAGQYQSLLNVRRAHLRESYLEVVAGKYTPQAMHYRLERGLRDEDVAMSVGFLVMVDARAGGVAYTGNPADRDDRNIYISSAWGLPKAIVDGRFASDFFVVDRAPPVRVIRRELGDKGTRFALDPMEGVQRSEVPEELRCQPSLTDQQAVEIAGTALRLEAHFGSPVDVEWAVTDDGGVVVLQCRPLVQSAAAARRPQPAGIPSALVTGGVGVSPGVGAGPVHRVRRDGDALTFPERAVLVVGQPLPRWAALLGRAAAVVAETGGVAGHLATVARELRVPAVFGAGSLAALEDGAEVTVDAGCTAVYPGRVEPLLASAQAASSAPPDTPVRTALGRALRWIAPLNLLDPDSLGFEPSGCRTLHDITRFCHEKAVREMFDFGREHRFPKHASKQLYHNVPMQWWVLDLEDGFTREISGRYVRLEEIACRPMLALWRGMTAVPWAGPPAMSGRGFASVLFEATANPALSTPFRKPYAQQNYFMISQRFVNLQSRFGFHFAAVESVVSDREHESYLSFSFKGGAADLERRAARVAMICGLLEECGFAVEARDDHAAARVAALPAPDMERRLEVVGYLIMHTRQLDMIMGHPATVDTYRAKLRADIENIVGGSASF